MKYSFAFFSIILYSTTVFSQELISPAGETSTAAGSEVSWSVGELATETGTVGESTITQGYEQSKWTITVIPSGESEIEQLGKMSIYPNPTQGRLNITPDGFMDQLFQLELWDMSGKKVQEAKFDQNGTQLETTDLSSAQYILIIRSTDNSYLEKFNVIKSN